MQLTEQKTDAANRKARKGFWPRRACILAFGVSLSPLLSPAAQSHDASSSGKANIEACANATRFGESVIADLASPYNKAPTLTALSSSPLGGSILKNLWVNPSKAHPCFAISDTPIWGVVVSRIPADVVGIEVADGLGDALVYVTGIPDYTIETPKLFTGFKPGNIFGVYKLAAEPKADARRIHEFASKGPIAIFVNGSSIFNYTDTFTYNDKGAFSYDANVAEATIVNSDVAHATPSNFPLFPKSRGIFHNHQMSQEFMKELDDPFARGEREHSKVIGFGIDSYPIYGPLGYNSKDTSSGIGVLKSSYLKRDWMSSAKAGTNHRSSVPGWIVRGWNNDNAGANLLNLSQKPKADLLFSESAKDGPVRYKGGDEKLSAEISRLSETKGLKRDDEGYVYWESDVGLPSGSTAVVRNYLLNSSDLWGPDMGQEILPVSYQIADQDKFRFSAFTGAFAEDYEFISGYGDLDFYNGIESFVPDQNRPVYHYVTPYNADITDKERLSKASFPYFIGIQFKGVVDRFNSVEISEKEKWQYLVDNRRKYKTVFDLGVIGKDVNNDVQYGSVIDTWRTTLAGGE